MITITPHNNIALATIEYGKVNALDTKLLAALQETLQETGSADALVLTGSGRNFSAGVDLSVILTASASEIELFVRSLTESLQALLDFPRPVVAAINGNAIAGGAAMTFTADFRIMSAGRIGMSEMQLGVPLPSLIFELVRSVAGIFSRKLIQNSLLLKPKEAREAGVVDETCRAEDLLNSALMVATRLSQLPRGVFETTKQQIQAPLRAQLLTPTHSEKEIAAIWSSRQVQQAIKKFLETLHK